MSQLQIEVGQGVQVSSHSSIYLLWVAIVCQVLVIRQDNNFMWRAYKEMAIMFQPSNHGQELPIPDIVVSFRWVESLREVRDRSASTLLISLKEDRSYCKQGGVHFQFELFGEIGLIKHRLGGYRLDQLFKCVHALLRPLEQSVFLREIVKWSRDCCEVLYKWPLVAQYAQCASNLFDVLKLSRPLSNPSDL